MLKPDGYVILTTTNLSGLQYRLLLFLGILPNCLHPSTHKTWPFKGTNPKYGHKSVFTHAGLKQVLKQHGFKIKKDWTHTIIFLPTFLSKIICRFLKLGTFSGFLLTSESRGK